MEEYSENDAKRQKSRNGREEWFSTLQSAHRAIDEYSKAIGANFILLSRRINGTNGIQRKRNRIMWCLQDNNPYMLMKTTLYECRYGKDRNKAKNERRKIEKAGGLPLEVKLNASGKIRYLRTQGSIKKNCSALLRLIEVEKFPEFKLENLTNKAKRVAHNSLSNKLHLHPDTVHRTKAWMVYFPSETEHSGHVVGKDPGFRPKVDEQVMTKVLQLMDEGIVSMTGINACIQMFVKYELFKDKEPPSPTDRRFFPTKDDILNHLEENIATLATLDADLAVENSVPCNLSQRSDDIVEHNYCYPCEEIVVETLPQEDPTSSNAVLTYEELPSAESVQRVVSLLSELNDMVTSVTSQKALNAAELELNQARSQLLPWCPHDQNIDTRPSMISVQIKRKRPASVLS